MTTSREMGENMPKLTIDHVGLFTDNLDALATQLEGFGLRLTPFTPQYNRGPDGEPVAAGTANRLAVLSRGYLEFLTPIADSPLASEMRERIDRYRGFHLIAFGSDNAQADHECLKTGGFEPLPLVNLQRPVKIEGKPDADTVARFSVVRVPPNAMSEGRIQICQHHTPEYVWCPPWSPQVNGWQSLSDIAICVEDADKAARRYAAFSGIEPRRTGDGSWLLMTGRGRIAILNQTACRAVINLPVPFVPCIPAIAVTCTGEPATIDLRPQAHGIIELIEPDGEPSWIKGGSKV